MKKILAIACVALSFLSAHASKVTVDNASRQALSITPDKQSGLNFLYVVSDLNKLNISYLPDNSSAAITVSRYSTLGGGYAEEVATTRLSDGTVVVASPEGDMGYIIDEGTKRTTLWIVDYSRHRLDLRALTPAAVQECGTTALTADGDGGEIAYYAVNGRKMALSRELKLSYSTLVWNADDKQYLQQSATETLEYLRPTIRVTAPLCNTQFTLSGDRFLSAWGLTESVSSDDIRAKAVEAQTWAVQTQHDATNEVPATTQGTLGGSAPCDVDFSAAVTDAAIFTEWQFSRSPEFEEITLRISEPTFHYQFTEEGVTYVRFYCANADASCDFTSQVYDVAIGASLLKCPNAFSPHNQDGVNDEWKVSYSSIVSFKCSIFNRFGQEITSFNDPAAGWDGKYKGKFVPAGVYYYVITAKGADGKKYNLSGDINIVNYQ